eukprot:247246-Prorocentrum_minimum.AAC.1
MWPNVARGVGASASAGAGESDGNRAGVSGQRGPPAPLCERGAVVPGRARRGSPARGGVHRAPAGGRLG